MTDDTLPPASPRADGGLPFEEDPAPGGTDPAALVLALDGFDGPIDVLLALAREQKVDLARLSILHLAEQYLAFVRAARDRHLDLAADYLVMAAWLAFLKSRLLLPVPQTDDEPSGAEMAAALQFQLRRLEAMRTAGQALIAQPRLGDRVFARGRPEVLAVHRHTVHDLTLHDLLTAYAGLYRRGEVRNLTIEPVDLDSVDQALTRITRRLGLAVDWTVLVRFLPDDLRDDLHQRSALSATFVASLELARRGAVDLRQEGGPFSPISLRRRR
ncbi:segregation and condensation protein A [Roseospira visakhapatnamensis]|uniref:Segregation and condensation protein A n=1 Tax=Roseospira visakhapatnamensis TaxID=390880 RepID=A0A7W6RC73_9PROT|nr:ScpA family protein [Roseospira visakhapatnamensis]MBB4265826.1 segregation and condensation protein A [Roseospira visakhapatnamensis]